MNTKIQNLVTLRWYAWMGVGILLLWSYLNQTRPTWIPSFSVWIFFAISNFFLQRHIQKITTTQSEVPLFLVALFDLAYLTCLLQYNGGAHNPFSILFIAICSVAAMNLSLRPLVMIIFACLFFLGFIYATNTTHHHPDNDYSFHLRGMWLANSIAVIVVSTWIFRLRQQNEKIAEKHRATQRILSQIERVESMGRLLATTAHQLNTPLATLQLGISELGSQNQPLSAKEKKAWLQDLQTALNQMTTLIQNIKTPTKDSQEETHRGQRLDFVVSLEALIMRWAATRNVTLTFHSETDSYFVHPKHLNDVTAVMEALLENAFDATPPGQKPVIQVYLEFDTDFVIIKIRDEGIGMDAETLSRACEPLFTTKKKGTGLGLYIAHQFAQKGRGTLHIDSTLHHGSVVTLKLAKDFFA